MLSLLEVKGLKKYFPVTSGLFKKTVGWIKAVDNISFSIEEGQTFALVGESGCGKTTTGKVILLLEKPTDGTVLFQGQEIFNFGGEELRRYRSSVQALFQNPTASLSPRMRMGSIVAEPLRVNSNLPRKVIQERVGKVLTQVGLVPEMARLFPHEFSGGQRQRIGVARSLVVRPKLIILDEPVSALDVSIQAQILNLLKDLQEQTGTSYMLIAHNLATVRYMSDSIGVMYLGKLVEHGLATKVFENQLHPYTKALFAAALPFHPNLIKEEVELSGEVPSALSPPSGCRLHPRCSSAMRVCSHVEPELRALESGHYVACHLYQ